MSASISGEPTQIKALSAFFKSDKENNNIKYFTVGILVIKGYWLKAGAEDFQVYRCYV